MAHCHRSKALQPLDGTPRHRRGLHGLAIGRVNLPQRQRPVMPRVAILAEHHDVFWRFKSTARICLVMDFQVRRGGAERTLMASTFEREAFDAEPVIGSQVCPIRQAPQGSDGAIGLLVNRTPSPISRSDEGHITLRGSFRALATTSASVRYVRSRSCSSL